MGLVRRWSNRKQNEVRFFFNAPVQHHLHTVPTIWVHRLESDSEVLVEQFEFELVHIIIYFVKHPFYAEGFKEYSVYALFDCQSFLILIRVSCQPRK